jgi:hypothetical protein
MKIDPCKCDVHGFSPVNLLLHFCDDDGDHDVNDDNKLDSRGASTSLVFSHRPRSG